MNDDEVITAVREQRGKVHSHTSVEQIISRGRSVRARRRIPGAVTALAVVAAAGTALALGLTGGLGAAPARSTDTIRTMTFTLVKHANGTATLTINRNVLLEPGTLQSDLARDGIRAMVTVGRFCSSDPAPCPASFWMGMTATLWLGMSGDGKGPAGGFGGALWCPGCRGGGQVVAVSRSRG